VFDFVSHRAPNIRVILKPYKAEIIRFQRKKKNADTYLSMFDSTRPVTGQDYGTE
jgi:hypothetical protein